MLPLGHISAGKVVDYHTAIWTYHSCCKNSNKQILNEYWNVNAAESRVMHCVAVCLGAPKGQHPCNFTKSRFVTPGSPFGSIWSFHVISFGGSLLSPQEAS